MENINHNLIVPWLSVQDGHKAIRFYKEAFGAEEKYRLGNEDGSLVVKLSVNGAEFWVSAESKSETNVNAEPLGGNSVRIILIVADPDAFFDKALIAGATEVFPVGEDHGWRLGRLIDPFGLHWEIGYELQ